MHDAEQSLRSLLSGTYGVTATTIAVAPRGFVADTYAVTATDGRRYFAKQLPLWADAGAGLAGVDILDDPSAEQRRYYLAELGQTCFVWLWPAIRRLDSLTRPEWPRPLRMG